VKLLGKVSLKFLQLGFAGLLYLSAMRLIWSSTPDQLLEGNAAIAFLVVVGFFAGGEIARHHVYGYTGVLTVFTGHG
jgi:hypothetical protein